MFLHSLMCMSVWCVAIHEMPAINEITAKIDHVLFTCSCFFGLRRRTQRACSCRKAVLRSSSNFSNCDGVYFQKRITSATGESALKENSITFVFLYCDVNQFNQSMEISFFFYLHFLLQPFTNQRTAGEGRGHLFNSSLPLPPASQTLRHQSGDYCRELTPAQM